MIVISQPFSLFLPQYLAAERHKSAGHCEQLTLTMARLDDCFLGSVTPQNCRRFDVDVYRQWRRDPKNSPRKHGQPISEATLNKDLANLKAVVTFCWRSEERAAPLPIQLEGVTQKNPIAWWPEEEDRIFASCANERGMFGHCPKSLCYQALGATLYSTGSRIGALVACPLSAFDREHAQLFVAGEDQKHDRDEVHGLHAPTVRLLKLMVDADPWRQRLFPFPFKTRCLREHWKNILERAGLPHDRLHLFHCLRKTFVTRVVQGGGTIEEAQRLCGHSSPAVTRRYLDRRQITRLTSPPAIPEPRVTPAVQCWLFE